MSVPSHGVAADLSPGWSGAEPWVCRHPTEEPRQGRRKSGSVLLSVTRFAGSLALGQTTQGSARTSLHPGLSSVVHFVD